MSKSRAQVIPRHIAIIMDGNGRWAKKRRLPRIAGHRKGVDTVKKIVRACDDRGVKFLTLYTFSTENWKRPRREVEFLMQLLRTFLQKEIKELDRKNVRFRTIGHTEALPQEVRNVLTDASCKTEKNTGLTLILALNYGSRRELVDAAVRLGTDMAEQAVRPEEIDEQYFARYLYTAGFPDPELLIRTSGEMRISNFLLWQLSYSEFYITDKYWPDFDAQELDKALTEFTRRERRFGDTDAKKKNRNKISAASLRQRVVTAGSIIAFILFGLFWLPQLAFAIVVTLLIGFGLHEFYSLIEKKGILIYKYIGIILGILIPISIYFRFEPTKGWELFFITAATLIFFVLQFIRKDSSQAIVGISTTLFGIFYVSWFFSYLIKIRFLPQGTFLVGFLLLVTKISDVGAYLTGIKYGRHILITRISPKKTLEGAIGGFVFSVGAALLSKAYLPTFSLPHLLLLGVLLGVLAQVGDFCESLIKRDCGVKDSGSFFPGMGGVLDIIDSVIFTSPIFYFYLMHFKLTAGL